jgi:multidrug efflux pump subunit AcrB
MDKFIKITVGADSRLIRVSDVAKVVATLTTSTTITYIDGATAVLTHAAATGEAAATEYAALIGKALVTGWQNPVLDATGADAPSYAVSAIV